MDAIGARSRGQESMHCVNRLLEEAADTVALDSGEKFFEGIAIGRKQILPDGRVSLLVDNLEYPISLCTGWPVYAENHHHVVVDKFAGEFRKLVLLFIIRHGALYHKWPCRATGACVQFCRIRCQNGLQRCLAQCSYTGQRDHHRPHTMRRAGQLPFSKSLTVESATCDGGARSRSSAVQA